MLFSIGARSSPGTPTVTPYRSGEFFYIHCDPVHKTGVYYINKSVGKGAVRVELYLVAKPVHLFKKFGDVAVQKRLPRDGDAVQRAPALPEKGENSLLIRVVRQPFRQHERGIVAEGAAEIAAARKHRARHPPGVIEQG